MSIIKTNTSFRTSPMDLDGRIREADVALAKAGLDFTVDSTPIQHLTPFEHKYGDKYFAAVRSTDQAILGVNSSRFVHFQPSVLGVLAEAIVKVRPDAYISAGGLSLDERTQFLVVTLDDEPIVGPHGKHNRNIMLTNGTNGNRMLQGIAFDFTFHCMNQFPALLRRAKKGGSLFKLGHNWSGNQALPTAIQAVQDATRVFDDLDREIETLLSTKISDGEASTIFAQVAGKEPDTKDVRAFNAWQERKVNLLREYCAQHNDYAFGSAWGVVMAAEALDEHGSKCRKGARDQQRMTRVATASYPHMERAFELLDA